MASLQKKTAKITPTNQAGKQQQLLRDDKANKPTVLCPQKKSPGFFLIRLNVNLSKTVGGFGISLWKSWPPKWQIFGHDQKQSNPKAKLIIMLRVQKSGESFPPQMVLKPIVNNGMNQLTTSTGEWVYRISEASTVWNPINQVADSPTDSPTDSPFFLSQLGLGHPPQHQLKQFSQVIQSDLFGMVKWPFQRLSDLQLGDKRVTKNHQVYVSIIPNGTHSTNLWFNTRPRIFVSRREVNHGNLRYPPPKATPPINKGSLIKGLWKPIGFP